MTQRHFLVCWPPESPGWDGPYSLAEMLDANADDPAVVAWCRDARPGDTRDFGGGAAALCRVKCKGGAA